MLCVAVATVACGGGGGIPTRSPLDPVQRRAAYLPDATDRAAHDLAIAALAAEPAEARTQLAALQTTERLQRATGEAPSGLNAYAQHLVDATSDDAIEYRRATAELLDRRDIDPALRKQLEAEVADDPLLLAKQRIAEGRQIRLARAVNAVAEAMGRSVLTFVMAPVRIGQAVVKLVVAEYLDDPISLQERQALVHWKQYVDTHPETPAAHALLAKIESMNRKWFETKQRRSRRAATQALEHDQNELALLLAERSLRYAPDDTRTRRLRDTAEERIQQKDAELAQSLTVTPDPLPDLSDPRAHALLVALLLPDGDIVASSDAVLAGDPEGPLADPARFARANALAETQMWDSLAQLANDDAETHPMARHARALVDSPTQNPWQAFEAAQGSDTRKTAAGLALGPLATGPRDRDLPLGVEWLLEAPTLVPILGGIPWRVLQTAIAPPETKGPALAASLYLQRYPDGVHASELRRWLIDQERDRKHYVRAHSLAAEDPSFDPTELAELAELAAGQSIEMADKQKRRDVRLSILQAAVTRYPNTASGDRAAVMVRETIENVTEQRVRISRGFLVENPVVAGPDGIGLRRELLDGNVHNAELHPNGVTLLGGRTIEIALVDVSGDEKDEPATMRQTISRERLSRLVSLLEETTLRNALLDPLAEQPTDARRDQFFERARLGVADTPDVRATAESSFVFVGMREKYKMVRTRESILPVEIVISGSLPDLGLGAFPRIRMPKETPDAVLYK